MAISVHVPRINNNDDEVKLVELRVATGDAVKAGQVLASVETDKAVLDVESPADGVVLAVQGEVESQVRVGSVLMWLGSSADEPVPVQASNSTAAGSSDESTAPTAKALALLRELAWLRMKSRPALVASVLTTFDVMRRRRAWCAP